MTLNGPVWFLLPAASGMLLATGQFFMKRLSVSIPSGLDIPRLLLFVMTSPATYCFLAANLAATVTYLATLRTASLTLAFATIFFAMGVTVLFMDLFINRVQLSAVNVIGAVTAVAGIVMLLRR